jgi:hypothetical protein
MFLGTFKLHNYIGLYLTLLFQVILALLITLFLLGFIFTLQFLKQNKPAAILNKDGIWVNYYNFISWQDIDDFDTYMYKNLPIEFISISVKDIHKLSKNASLYGKIGIFWSKIFGYPPITLAGLELENDEIITFAKQLLKKIIDR